MDPPLRSFELGPGDNPVDVSDQLGGDLDDPYYISADEASVTLAEFFVVS